MYAMPSRRLTLTTLSEDERWCAVTNSGRTHKDISLNSPKVITRLVGGFGLFEMSISTNPKPTIYRNLYENTGPEMHLLILELSGMYGPKKIHAIFLLFYLIARIMLFLILIRPRINAISFNSDGAILEQSGSNWLPDNFAVTIFLSLHGRIHFDLKPTDHQMLARVWEVYGQHISQ